MKKFVAMLLVLSMVLALAGTALAAPKYVVLKKDSNAYTAPKESKKTKNVACAGSVAQLVCVRNGFVKVIVNPTSGKTVWFKKCNVAAIEANGILVIWAKGGLGMSTCRKSTIVPVHGLRGMMLKVTGHTNLRKNPGMKFKSQGVVEKCDRLKAAGRVGFDDRGVMWFEVCKSGKKLWVSSWFVEANQKLIDVLVEAGVVEVE